MRIHSLVAVVALATLPSCYQFAVTAHAGFAQYAIEGDLGYVDGSSAAAVDQDVESAFGIGDDQGTPVARIAIDTGVPVLSASGFMFDEQGSGVLQGSFGNAFAAGLPVNSDFELTNLKAAYAFKIPLGPVSVSPGVGLDYFDLTLELRDQFGFGRETLELKAPVPIGFLRGEVNLGDYVSLLAEGGYMSILVDDFDMTLLDIEAMLMVRPTKMLDLFVGYRMIDFEGEGEIESDRTDANFQFGGFMIGGGVRF